MDLPSSPIVAPPTADAQLQQARLGHFLRAMLPVAIAFDVAYGMAALWLRSSALAGGAFAVALYVVAVAHARTRLDAGAARAAALWTGCTLLVMVAVGAVFLHFLLGALVIMPLAGVALVMPYARRPQFRAYIVCALAVTAEVIVVDGVFPALFRQPPALFSNAVLVSAALAATGLTIQLLWVDHTRLEHLLAMARQGLAAAEEANATKDAFLAAAAHDLRTPLATLQLHVDGIVHGPLAEKVQDARLRERLHRIEKQTSRLARLVDGLLDVSRIAGGRFELADEPLDLAALVRDAVTRLEEEVTRSGSELRIALPASLATRGDRVRLEQMVSNLVSNAVKYGGAKPVEVSLVRDGTRAVISVRDAGIGIAPEDQARIFERFERAPEAANYSGLGMGLWIVRELVARMGGTITVESALGRGSTFTVRLPIASDGEVAA